MECEVVTSDRLLVASVSYQGPAGEAGTAFEHLIRWAQVHHIERWSPLVWVHVESAPSAGEGAAMAGYVAGEAWFPIPPGMRDVDPSDSEVLIKEVDPQRVARCVHRGFPDALAGSVAELARWMAERGLMPSAPWHRQLYLAAPPGSPGDWVVEVQVPVAR